jgi:hypothetical protein
LTADVSGHLTPSDVQLKAGETTDSKSYIERTLPSTLKLAYKNKPKNGGILVLPSAEMKQIDALGGINKYLVEPYETIQERSRVI